MFNNCDRQKHFLILIIKLIKTHFQFLHVFGGWNLHLLVFGLVLKNTSQVLPGCTLQAESGTNDGLEWDGEIISKKVYAQR